MQVNERALVVTKDGRIMKLDPSKKFKPMLKVDLRHDFSGNISISPDGGNQLVVIHLNASAGNDLVLSLVSAGSTGADMVGELIAAIASRTAHLYKVS